MADTCALCHKPWSWLGGVTSKEFSKGNNMASLANHGGGNAICDKCVKAHPDQIKKHNALYYNVTGGSKDPNCQHDWAHPYCARWACRLCPAEYNWTCGHGGSQYACQPCYTALIARMVNECGTVENYLNKHSW